MTEQPKQKPEYQLPPKCPKCLRVNAVHATAHCKKTVCGWLICICGWVFDGNGHGYQGMPGRKFA